DRERLKETLVLDVDLGAQAAPVRELDLGQVEMDAALLPVAVQPIIAAVVHVRDPLLEQRDAREALLPHDACFVITISAPAIEEADLRLEVAPHLDDARDVAPGAGLVSQARAVRPGAAVRTRHGRGRAPPVERPRVPNADASVEAVHAVPISGLRSRHPLHG